jgi:TRAP-type C4-dicarboxylate transport system permease small subunit
MFAALIKTYENIQKTITILLLVGIVFATFLQVFTRYVLNSSFMWTEEAARAFGIWMVMIAAGILVKNNDHIGLDLIPAKYQFMRRILTNLLTLFFSLWLLPPSFAHVAVAFSRLSSALRVPLWIFYVAMPIGFINIAFWGLFGLIKELALLKKIGDLS